MSYLLDPLRPLGDPDPTLSASSDDGKAKGPKASLLPPKNSPGSLGQGDDFGSDQDGDDFDDDDQDGDDFADDQADDYADEYADGSGSFDESDFDQGDFAKDDSGDMADGLRAFHESDSEGGDLGDLPGGDQGDDYADVLSAINESDFGQGDFGDDDSGDMAVGLRAFDESGREGDDSGDFPDGDRGDDTNDGLRGFGKTDGGFADDDSDNYADGLRAIGKTDSDDGGFGEDDSDDYADGSRGFGKTDSGDGGFGEEDWDDYQEKIEAIDQRPEDSYASGGLLFDEDRGNFPMAARLALCKLLEGPYIDKRTNKENYNAMVKYEGAINVWLGEIFLELVLDEDLGVGFIRQIDESQIPRKVPNLLRRKSLNFFESLLLIHLRQKLTEADLQGYVPTVTVTELTEFLKVYESKSNTDHAKFESRVAAAISNMHKKFQFLHAIYSSDETFRISPVLKLILSPDAINLLIPEYRNFKHQGLEVTDPEEGDLAAKKKSPLGFGLSFGEDEDFPEGFGEGDGEGALEDDEDEESSEDYGEDD
ncbi:MAG: DUF4194 domain-containing protein [Deltaproteobacteria bacterium]|jgi:hypothetical protein|nr:DUF4194 domain-containing protein [Deltaproteobacteria bacterium]